MLTYRATPLLSCIYFGREVCLMYSRMSKQYALLPLLYYLSLSCSVY